MPATGPFYIVDNDREDPTIEWISAECDRKVDAQEFAGNAGGRILTSDDVPGYLVEMWRAHDFSRHAHMEAGQSLAELRHDLSNISQTSRDDLIERYADSDPACAELVRASDLIRQMREAIEEIIPPGTPKYQGVHIEGPWPWQVETPEPQEKVSIEV